MACRFASAWPLDLLSWRQLGQPGRARRRSLAGNRVAQLGSHLIFRVELHRLVELSNGVRRVAEVSVVEAEQKPLGGRILAPDGILQRSQLRRVRVALVQLAEV